MGDGADKIESIKCRSCKEDKDLSFFWKTKAEKTGRSRECKQCHQIRRSTPKNRDSARKKDRERYKLKPRQASKEHKYAHTLLRYSGISVEDYNAMLSAQSGVCKICGSPPAPRIRLAVDHCHATGEIRGLLCTKCNQALGLLHDSIAALEKAVQYIKTSRTGKFVP